MSLNTGYIQDRQMDLMLQDDTLSSIDMCIMSECKAWKCPKCSRLYILDSKTNDVLGVYKPEIEYGRITDS